jgi:AraC-like DNA-binding protein
MDQATHDTALSLDLSQVDAAESVSAWRDWLRMSFPEFSLESMAPSPDGGARVLSLGSARLWQVHFPARITIRAAPAVSFRRDAFVSFQLAGARTVVRDGRVFRVGAGEVCIGRAALDGVETTYEDGTSILLLELPSRCVTSRHPQVESWSYHVCRTDQPGAALLHDLLAGVMTVGGRLGEYERRAALASIIELLALPVVGVRSKDAHVLRVELTLGLIDERLGDPRLSAEMLASEQGISRRRLDEVFVQTLGSSAAACIAQRRLARAAQLLKDPSCNQLSVASVALSVGFRDASHFARAFKTRFGATPMRWRLGAASPAT